MNYQGSQSMSSVTLSSPDLPGPAGIGSVVAVADQVAAAIGEVNEAWRGFLYGTSNETTGPAIALPPTDRIQAGFDSLNLSVDQLKSLAADIRSRS